MNFYEGTIATVIIGTTLVLAGIFMAVYFILSYKAKRAFSILFRIGTALLHFGCVYFGMCKFTEIMDLTNLQATLCIVAIYVLAEVVNFFLLKKDRHR